MVDSTLDTPVRDLPVHTTVRYDTIRYLGCMAREHTTTGLIFLFEKKGYIGVYWDVLTYL